MKYTFRSNQKSGFRSELENQIAIALTQNLGMNLEYEPEKFCFNGFHYTPDFVSSDLHGRPSQYFEIKPKLSFANQTKMKAFCFASKKDLILCAKDGVQVWEYISGMDHKNEFFEWVSSEVPLLLHCKKCNHFSFCTLSGSYACRYCGFHDGDASIYFDDAQKIKQSIF